MRKLLENMLRVQDEFEFDYIVVVVPHALDLKTLQLQEGRWFPSKKNGWSYRIDPPNSQLNQQRHVHIARDEHIKAKNMQAAWNQDGTRHDKGTFNQSIGGTKAAQRIARDVLGLPDDRVLEWASSDEMKQFVNESASSRREAIPASAVLLVLSPPSA